MSLTKRYLENMMYSGTRSINSNMRRINSNEGEYEETERNEYGLTKDEMYEWWYKSEHPYEYSESINKRKKLNSYFNE